jgi:O-antigen/teichoic acid export membrane protein
MSIREKAIRGVIWSAIQNWGSQAGSLIVFFVLARLLPPEAFGLIALSNVFLTFMQVFLEQGFAQALIQRKHLEPEHLNTAFWTSVGIGVVLLLLGFGGAGTIAVLFKQPQLTPILQWLSLLFLINAFGNVQRAILERKFAFKSIAARSLFGTLTGGVIGVVMAYLGYGVWSLVGQQLVSETVAVLVLWRASDWRPGLQVSSRHFRDLFSFGVNILGFNLLSFINTRADDFLIGYFLGPVALGYYAIAYRVLTIMTQLLTVTSSQVALPTFSRLQEDLERFRKAFYMATRFTSAIAFPTFLGMAVLAPELVTLLFGEQWMPSVPVMRVLAFMGIMQSVSYFKGSVFMAMGKPSWRLWISMLNAFLNIIGFSIAVHWGIIAVAAAYVIRGYMVFPISQSLVSRLIQTPLLTYLKQFIPALISSLVMTIAILVAKFFLIAWLNPFALLVVCTLLGAIVYVASIRVLSPELFQQLFNLVQLALSGSKRQNA